MHNAVTKTPVNLESPTKGRYNHGQYPCNGMYFAPEGVKVKTAIIASHYSGDWSHHYLAEHMARRGYGFLGWNTRFVGPAVASGFVLEHALIDLGVGVRWLKEVAGVEKVVIVGNSGGASLMGAYQAQAMDPHVDPGTAPAEELLRFIPADLYISIAAHPGRARVFTDWLDPSVTDESDPLSCDESLSMFNPENGPSYSPEFIAKYRAGQVARNERITQWAISRLQRLREGIPSSGMQLTGNATFGVAGQDGVFDEFFGVPRQFAALEFEDLSIDPSKRAKGCYMGDTKQATYSNYGLLPMVSCREWLTVWSLSQTPIRAELYLPRITQSSLVIYANHDQGAFNRYSQEIYDGLGSSDKTLMGLDGSHYFEDPALGSREAVADVLAGWMEDHAALPA